MKRERQRTGTTGRTLAAATAIVLLGFTFAWAAPPEGKGGGGGGTTPRYKIVELAHELGDAFGINASGDCVGEIIDVDGLQKPYLWLIDASGGVTPLPLSRQVAPDKPEVPAGSAQDINADGLIVGFLVEPGVQTLAAYWANALADPIILPLPEGALDSRAYAVNSNDVIVGEYRDALALLHPVAWGLRGDGTVAGPVEMLAAPAIRGVAWDVNNSQAVVGWQAVVGGTSGAEAWRWQLSWDGNTLSLAGGYSLTPLFPAGSYVDSFAFNVNNNGDICGYRNPGGRADAFFLQRVGGTLVDQPLALLIDNDRTGSANHYAYALNDVSPPQIVGEASTFSKRSGSERGQIAVIWQGSTAVDLEKAARSSTLTASPSMWAINDNGWIAGHAWTGESEIYEVPSVTIPSP